MLSELWGEMTEKNQNLAILILLTVGTVVGGILLSVCAYFLSGFAGDIKDAKVFGNVLQRQQDRQESDISSIRHSITRVEDKLDKVAARADDRFTGSQAQLLTERVHSLELWRASVSHKLLEATSDQGR